MRRLSVLGILVGLLWLAGCSDDGDSAGTESTPEERPSRSVVVAAGNQWVPVTRADGTDGRYRLHLPPAYDGGRSLPLVLVFHGAPGTPQEMVGRTGFDALADEEGFAVVYPDAFDDPADVAALLEDVEERVPLDPRRIYATGFSRGGSTTYLLTSELADRIAAFAPTSGVPYAISPQGPVSVLAIQGLADESVTGSASFNDGWRQAAGCGRPAATSTTLGARPARRIVSSCRGGSEFVLIEVEGMGHTWPKAATPVIWDFFEAHPLTPPVAE